MRYLCTWCVVANTGTHWESLQRWTPWLYLAAGAVLSAYAALNGLLAFTDVSVEADVFQAGYVLGFLGLLGLYPRLADRSPWLARIGGSTALLGLVAFSVFTANRLAELGGLASGNPPGWAIFTAMAAAGFVVGYLAVGAAALRTGAYPRIVGLLLLLPAIIIVLMFATMATGLVSPESVFVVSAGQAMTHLAIGATLEVESDSPERKEAESTQDATARG